LTTESIFSESAPQIKALVRNPSAFSTLFAPGKFDVHFGICKKY
jgi:hypothetical protein